MRTSTTTLMATALLTLGAAAFADNPTPTPGKAASMMHKVRKMAGKKEQIDPATGRYVKGSQVITLKPGTDRKTGKPIMIQHGGTAGKKGRVMQVQEMKVQKPGFTPNNPNKNHVKFVSHPDKKGQRVTLTPILTDTGHFKGGTHLHYVEHGGKAGKAGQYYMLGKKDPKTGHTLPVNAKPKAKEFDPKGK